MKVYITGVQGYLGSAIATRLRDAGHDVWGLDNQTTAKVDALEGVPTYRHDATEHHVPDLIGSADAIIHCAALPGVEESRERPVEATRATLETTIRVTDACRSRGVPLVFPSTIGVYGGISRINVDTARRPTTVYARLKRAAEDVIEATARDAYPAVTFQLTNLYGDHEVDGETVRKRTAVEYFIDQARDGETLTVHEPGTQTRDFLHVTDAADAFVTAVETIPEWDDGAVTFPLGSGLPYSIRDIAETIAETASADVAVETAPNPTEPYSTRWVDSTEAKNRLGVDPPDRVTDYIAEQLGGDA